MSEDDLPPLQNYTLEEGTRCAAGLITSEEGQTLPVVVLEFRENDTTIDQRFLLARHARLLGTSLITAAAQAEEAIRSVVPEGNDDDLLGGP